MQLEDYLMDGETIEAKVEAYNRHDAYSDRYKGKLACTPLRVIYVNDHDVVDISLQSINSVDYTEPSLSQYQITTSVALSLLGVVGMILTPLLQSMSIIPPDLANSVAPGLVPIGLFFIGIGGYSLYRAYSQQRSELTLHTPNQSYDFSAEDSNLEHIIHAIRFQELNHKSTQDSTNQKKRRSKPQTR